MSEQLQRKRPAGTGNAGTDTDEDVTIDPGSTDEMQRKLKEAADRLEKKKVAEALKQAQQQARPRRRSCCCC